MAGEKFTLLVIGKAGKLRRFTNVKKLPEKTFGGTELEDGVK